MVMAQSMMPTPRPTTKNLGSDSVSVDQDMDGASSLKLTRNRRLLMTILEQADGPLTALEICERAHLAQHRLSQGSVYRALKAFEDSGLVSRLTFGQECAKYEFNRTDSKDRIVRVSTGDILPVQSVHLKRLRQDIALQLGCSSSELKLEIRAHE